MQTKEELIHSLQEQLNLNVKPDQVITPFTLLAIFGVLIDIRDVLAERREDEEL